MLTNGKLAAEVYDYLDDLVYMSPDPAKQVEILDDLMFWSRKDDMTKEDEQIIQEARTHLCGAPYTGRIK